MKKLLVILALSLSTNAFAGILLEPYVGYLSGTKKQTGNPNSDVTGMVFGGRLGFTMPLVFAAVDYSSGDLTSKTTGATDLGLKTTDLGLVVGANLSIIRLWGGYEFASTAKLHGFQELKGSGAKVGAGFKLPALPISFNAEYLMNTYDKSGSQTLTNKVKANSVLVSISAPFDF
jgi:hypothetical protein